MKEFKLRHLWYIWGAWFLLVEIIAIRNGKEGDTLSEVIWDWRNQAGSFGYATIVAALVWLMYHFLREGPKN